MKKAEISFLTAVLLVGVLAIVAIALEDQVLPTGGSFYEGRVESAARTAAITAAVTAQSDTNATTTVTLYTPRRAGDILVGGAGGSDGVWIAKGTTTNDWVQVAP